jgi:hypothetical protein
MTGLGFTGVWISDGAIKAFPSIAFADSDPAIPASTASAQIADTGPAKTVRAQSGRQCPILIPKRRGSVNVTAGRFGHAN